MDYVILALKNKTAVLLSVHYTEGQKSCEWVFWLSSNPKLSLRKYKVPFMDACYMYADYLKNECRLPYEQLTNWGEDQRRLNDAMTELEQTSVFKSYVEEYGRTFLNSLEYDRYD